MRPQDPERIEFEYGRHGTLNLFCTLDVASGEVFGKIYERKSASEVLDFLRALRSHYPDTVLHVILGDLSTRKTPDVLEFVAADRQIHLHFPPKHGSWLNQVEIFFSVLVRRVIRRGTFRGLEDLKAKIMAFLSHWNAHEKKPLRRTILPVPGIDFAASQTCVHARGRAAAHAPGYVETNPWTSGSELPVSSRYAGGSQPSCRQWRRSSRRTRPIFSPARM